MKLQGMREFRSNLKANIEAGEPVVLGDAYHKRAVLIPITEDYQWDRGFAAKVDEAKRQARRVLNEIKGEK